jgi:alcohol dehydrogenase (cytochrome c)
MQHTSLRSLLLAGAVVSAACVTGASAAEVTFDRLANPDKEPQNWLMVHRSYDAQRFSPLKEINKDNVKNLRLLFAVAIGGANGNESVEATPLVEDGFMYIVDHWGVVYKIDVRSGKSGRTVWKMDPGQEKGDRNRGVTLWGNLVISVAPLDGRVIATDKETGKVVWDKNLHDQPDLELTAAPLALKDSIIVGGDRGVRD